MADIPVVCIDSCVIISHLNGGSDRSPADIPLLKGLFADIHGGKIHVLFPTLLRVELLECKLGKPLMDQFEQLTGLDNFDEIPVNSRIARLASEIRSFYKAENLRSETVPKIAIADCIFIATAIEEGCPKLFTYDGDREPPSKPRKLLALANPIAGKHALHIEKPNTVQLAWV